MRFLFPTLAALAVLLSPATGAEGMVFDQAYRPGYTYHQTMTMKQEMQMEMGAQKMDRQVSTTMGMLAVVTPHEDGTSKRVAIKYDSIQASIAGGGEKFTFDSKAPAAEGTKAGPLQAYGKIVGQEFKVIFNQKEDVTDVEQLDSTIQNLAGNDPASAQIYQQLFNRDAVKRMMQQSALRSPIGSPVKKGGSWPFVQELDLPGLGKLTIRGFYTYKGDVDRNGVKCAEVKASAEITMDTSRQEAAGDEAAQRLQQMQLKIEEGRMDGTLFYDKAIDFTRQIDVSHTITLTGKIPDGSGKGMRLPMKQTISMTLDEFKPTK
jgi:hypothetical protein